jgi:carbamate kinase
MITVDPDDPAFACPSTFVGPVYHRDAADVLAAKRGWAFRRDGTAWRRVVPSPEPRQILEIKPITWLLDHGAVVICACGGGIPAVHPTSAPGVPAAAEAVIDQDRASEMLAEDVGADLFLMATDVDGGPKMEAAVRFAAKTGKRAAIGSLADIGGIVAGIAGTNVITRPGRRRQVRAASVEAVPAEAGGVQSAPVSARNAATAASIVGKK